MRAVVYRERVRWLAAAIVTVALVVAAACRSSPPGARLGEHDVTMTSGRPTTATVHTPIATIPALTGAAVVPVAADATAQVESRPSQAAPTAPPGLPPTGAAWWDGRVFYEVFVRSFRDSGSDGIGDLQGLISRLDYLNDGDPNTTDDLGVTGLWLMPIMQSPSYHGYDTTDYLTVEQDYGTNAEFRQLIHEAHQRGMKVVIDFMLNHTSSEHPWFLDAASGPASTKRDWYVWSEEDDGGRTAWGSPVWHPLGEYHYLGLFWEGMPDLNYRNPAVSARIEEIARFWLEDMGADGFRLDAVRHLIEDGRVYQSTPETHRWLAGFDDAIDRINPEALTIGEIWDTTEEVAPYVQGDEVDLAFEFDLATALLQSARQGKPLITSGELSRLVEAYPGGQMAPFLTNHDQPRVMTQLGGDSAKASIAATALLAMPGVPFIYYGEEIGMRGDKPDEYIRTPMQWEGGTGAGFSSGTPWIRPNKDAAKVNVAAQSGGAGSLLNHYRRLIRTRADSPALSRGGLAPVESDCPTVLAFLRTPPAGSAGNPVLVALNFGARPADSCRFAIPQGVLGGGEYAVRELISGRSEDPRLVVQQDDTPVYSIAEALAPQRGMYWELSTGSDRS
jgi:glycosidase